MNKLKKYIKSKLDIVIVIGIFSFFILCFLKYSQTQKQYFEQSKQFTDWIQFNANGILILIGSMITIISVLMTIKHSDKVKSIDELNKKKVDLCLLDNQLVTYFNHIENDMYALEKILINTQSIPIDIYGKSLYKIEKDTVNKITMLALNVEDLFYDSEEKNNIIQLRKDVWKLYEIQKKSEVKGRLDWNLFGEKISIYSNYLNDEYKNVFLNLLNKVDKINEKHKENIDIGNLEYINKDNMLDSIENLYNNDTINKLIDDISFIGKNIFDLDKVNKEKFEFMKKING
ncbi:hypothetical protein [Clostridium perfringens]|uniref:hypothetical protein n=1 Tax=Clostridium perfringens TaxID=1502 RepID=UPI0018E4CBBF|nr:hypothetical protein [Clostridium perfringens]MBI6038976.1 hypothetical protein [Clostridium perfringens]MDM0490836.1 hypothetical protein [Clostridium perfringens]